MLGVFAAARAVLLYVQFLTAGLSPQSVVQLVVFFARQENDFSLLFAFGHKWTLSIGLFSLKKCVKSHYTTFS
jgi:hypothetical protein